MDILEGARHVPGRSKVTQRVGEGKGKYRGETVLSTGDVEKQIIELEKQMFNHAKELQFEEAAQTRDQIEELRQKFVRS